MLRRAILPLAVTVLGVASASTSGCQSSSSSAVTGDDDGGAIVDGATNTGPGADGGEHADAGKTSAFDGGPEDAGADAGDGGTSSAGCGVTGKPTGDLHLSATDGKGASRDYEVLVPSTYDPTRPLALAFVYHGAGGNQANAKSFGLQNAPGAASSAIFVYPQGVAFQSFGVGWDDTCGGYDMVLFDHMLAALEADYCIDRSRLFVAGFSWGGDQVTALACCRGDRIRAVGAASCTDEYKTAADAKTYDNLPCPAKTRAAIRFTHDANGDSAYPNPLFATTRELYRSFNGCSATSTPVSPSPCQSFAGCANPYVECAYTGLGHALPAGWGADTWSFFASFH